MSRTVKWLLVLVTAWMLGWYSHQHWSSRDNASSSERQSSDSFSSIAGKSGVGLLQTDTPTIERAGSRQKATFQEMLLTGQYQSAMQLFNAAGSQPNRQQYRTVLIRHINTLLQHRDYLQASQIISAYLDEHYRDVDVLLLRAKLQWLEGRNRQAIETLYDAKSYEYRTPQLASITRLIRTYVADYDRQLEDSSDDEGRLELYEYLAQVEPDHSPYFIALAQIQLTQNRLDDARHSLSLVESDPRVSDQARRLLKQIEDTVTFSQIEPIAIPLIRHGEHFLLDAWINGRVAVRLLIDTGASMTVLREDILATAGIFQPEKPPVHLFSTAGGLVEGAIYRLDKLSVGDQTVKNLEVAAMGLNALQSADGLLGMNFLKHFKFFIDQNTPELRLSTFTASD